MEYSKNCNCEGCNNSMKIEYFGKNLLYGKRKEKEITESDLLALNTVYFSFETSHTNRNLKGMVESSIRVSPSEIPEIMNKLQEAYSEYQKVQEELKKQGKLESLSQENKANLSEQHDRGVLNVLLKKTDIFDDDKKD
jgi:hypothetical protein